ncbi:uncharacterized protein [Palaemon carinicauda]|uniref:uncharacterized protein isoform X2 n=1 Tax=Palaemon carinicauda TaxID=392227 RepID=UPI0035B5F24F
MEKNMKRICAAVAANAPILHTNRLFHVDMTCHAVMSLDHFHMSSICNCRAYLHSSRQLCPFGKYFPVLLEDTLEEECCAPGFEAANGRKANGVNVFSFS